MTTNKQHRYMILGITAAAMALTSCDKLMQNGQKDTLSLLRSGSERVCAASDVQDSLRTVLLPKTDGFGGDADIADKQAAIKAVPISFDLTTLQAFDKSVSRATCATTIRIGSAEGEATRLNIDYQVSPSSDDAHGFVTSTRNTDAATSVAAAVVAAFDRRHVQQENDENTARQRAAQTQLLAVITPKWLVGTWIPTDDDGSSCSNSHGLTFKANHTFLFENSAGGWHLDQQQLSLVGRSPNGSPANFSNLISDADAGSFVMVNNRAERTDFRRCGPGDLSDDMGGDTTDPAAVENLSPVRGDQP